MTQYLFQSMNFRGDDGSKPYTDLLHGIASMPEGAPMTIAPERKEEFSPGLDPELLALIQATAEVELKTAAEG